MGDNMKSDSSKKNLRLKAVTHQLREWGLGLFELQGSIS